MCEMCDIRHFLKDQEWKILQDDEIIVNYSKDPEVDGHLVVQTKRHAEKITELSEREWTKLSRSIFEYSKAVEKALVRRLEGTDEVDKIYVWCFCRSPHDHLHFHIKPKLKSVKKQGFDFVNHMDTHRHLDKDSIGEIIEEIKKSI